MKRRILSFMLMFMIVISAVSIIVSAEEEVGEENDSDRCTYSIGSAEDFVKFINENKDAESKVYCMLTEDIKAEGEYKNFPANISAKNIVIDGQNHSVKGFEISGAMFKSLEDSSIRNINFDNIKVTAVNNQGAVIALETNKYTNITNCTFSNCTLDFSNSTKAEAGFAVVNNKGVIRSAVTEDTCVVKLKENFSEPSVIGGIVSENNYYLIGSTSMLKLSNINNLNKITQSVNCGLIAGENNGSSNIIQSFAVLEQSYNFGNNISFNPISSGSGKIDSCYYSKDSKLFNSKNGETFTKSSGELAVELNSKLMESNSSYTGEKEDYALFFKTDASGNLVPSKDGKEAWIKVEIDKNFYNTLQSGKEIKTVKFTPSDPDAVVICNDKNEVNEILTRVGYVNKNGDYIRNNVVVDATCKTDYYSLYSVINQLSYGYMTKIQDVFANEGTNYALKTFFKAENTSTNSAKAEVKFSPCNSKITISSITVNDQVGDYHFDGSGTEKVPFEIKTEEDLDVLRHYIGKGHTYIDEADKNKKEYKYAAAHYILKNDITLEDMDFLPIGGYTTSLDSGFEGVFDGNFHTISNYKYSDSNSYVGFFGLVKGTKEKPAVIKNLNIIDASVRMQNKDGNQRGILVGTAIHTQISGCAVSGLLEGKTQIGGLVGYASDTEIANCAVDVKINSNYVHAWAGGMIGYAQRSTVLNSYCISDITANSVVKPEYLDLGTIAGHSKDSQYSDCYYDCTAKNGDTKDLIIPSVFSGMGYKSRSSIKSDTSFLPTIKLNADKYSFDSQWSSGTAAFNSYPIPCTRKGLEYFVIPVASSAGSITTDTAPKKEGSTISVSLSANITSIEVTDLGGNKLDLEVTLDSGKATFTMPDRSIRIVPVSSKPAIVGSGTEADPFVINDVESLKVMIEAINSKREFTYYEFSNGKVTANNKNYMDASFALGADIDGKGTSVSSISIFRGTIDGRGHSVSNLAINGNALFEKLNRATIKNIIFEKIEIKANSDFTAVISATTQEYCTIINATFRDISVTGGTYFGCITGLGGGANDVENCYFENIESNAEYKGWLSGWFEFPQKKSSVYNCIFANCPKNIVGDRDAFSLVFSPCDKKENLHLDGVKEVTGEVLTEYSAKAEQYESYALWGRDAQGKAFVAGGDNLEMSRINLGIDDKDKAIFTNSSQIKLLDTTRIPKYATEGNTVTLYYYANTSLVDFRILYKGQKISYTTSDEVDADGYSKLTFTMPEGQVTLSNNYADTVMIIPGNGTDDSPYIISSVEELKFMRRVVNNEVLQYKWYDESYVPYNKAHFKLANDIDCKGNAWTTTIGTDKIQFNGVFDGCGHTIKNLNVEAGVEDGNRQGLFAVIGQKATVKNLIVDNASVFPAETPVEGAGVIAKQNYGKIEKCIVTNSSVQLGNWNYLGGIAGYNGGTIKNCSVVNSHLTRRWGGSTSKTMGGITEKNYCIVENCYTYGCSFSGGTIANGAIIESGYTPKNCYYFTNSSVNETYGTKKTVQQFANGEVASLLNNGVTDGKQLWYQIIDNGKSPDKYPVLVNNGENTVYFVNTSYKPYSNFSFEQYLERYLEKDKNGSFIIRNYEVLCAVAAAVNSKKSEYVNGSYILANDIDCTGRDWTTPIGIREAKAFKGKFDGNNHTIKNLSFDKCEGDYVGLFGFAYHAEISNLNVVLNSTSSINGAIEVGGICGSLEYGNISNCAVSGELIVDNATRVGGICGYLTESDISNCAVSGKLIVDDGVKVGGICGSLTESDISNCTTNGEIVVNKAKYVGGICGYLTEIGISNCTANGEIVVNEALVVGGVIGDSYDSLVIEKCIGNASLNINDASKVGGVCGDTAYDKIKDCAFLSKIECENATYIGGITGRMKYNAIENSYSYGAVGDSNNIVGYNDKGEVNNCYYLGESETDSLDGTTAKSAEQFANGEVASLLNNGVTDGSQSWYQNIDNGKSPDKYPVLVNNDKNTVYKVELPSTTYSNLNLSELEKDENGRFIIRNYDDLCLVAAAVNSGKDEYANASYILANDIDCTGRAWTTPIGISDTKVFKGKFDGNNHTIKNLSFDKCEGDYVGLFGYADHAEISNLNAVLNSTSSISAIEVGGICGCLLYGNISNCAVSGKLIVDHALFVGGICGYPNRSNISNCAVSGKLIVDDGNRVGGICGYLLESDISNCTANGEIVVNEATYVGGVIGYKRSGFIEKCRSGLIEKCIGNASLNINNAYEVGGVCGHTAYDKIKDCAFLSKIECENATYIGGITGRLKYNAIENSYSYGAVGDSNNIVGYNDKGEVNNCYYLGESETDRLDGTTAKSAEQFANGEVASLLNGGVTDGTQSWYQNIDNGLTPDKYPVLVNNDNNTVCKVKRPNITYSNLNYNELEKDAKGNFIIETYEDLCIMAEMVNSGTDEYVNGSYILANDIDCTGRDWTTPIGDSNTKAFKGKFDGNNHTIKNLSFDKCRRGYIGLFGFADHAEISNLNVVLNSTSSINGAYDVGGICGTLLYGNISNCAVSGKLIVDDGDRVGGICGYLLESDIRNCKANGEIVVNKATYVGGVIGFNQSGFVEKCIGNASLNINDASVVGGVCGTTLYVKIKDCAFLSKIECENAKYIGGIAGYMDDNAIENSYSYGAVGDSNNIVGHTVGAEMNNCYYLGESETDSLDGTTAKSAEQFANGEVASLLNGGVTDGTQSWYQNIDNGLTPDNYPVLVNNDNNTVYKVKRPSTTHSNQNYNELEKDAIIIVTYEDLCTMAEMVNSGTDEYVNGNYILANDIDCTGRDWTTPIGNSEAKAFKGKFDGNNHTIKNLSFDKCEANYVGLFGLAYHAEISNLNVVLNSTSSISAIEVGGICGSLQYGNISNCAVSGELIVDNAIRVGGICGQLYYSDISNCTANGEIVVNKASFVGGVIGYSYSGLVIEKCIGNASLNINDASKVGGVCGNSSYDKIKDCAFLSKIECENATYIGGITGSMICNAIENSYIYGAVGDSYNFVGSAYEVEMNNCYYLGESETDSLDGTTAKSAEQFANGEVASLLNGGVTDGTQSWYQNIDNGLTPDNYPVLVNNDNNTVYKTGNENKPYSNYII